MPWFEGGGGCLVDVIGVTSEIAQRTVTSSRAFDISLRSFRITYPTALTASHTYSRPSVIMPLLL